MAAQTWLSKWHRVFFTTLWLLFKMKAIREAWFSGCLVSRMFTVIQVERCKSHTESEHKLLDLHTFLCVHINQTPFYIRFSVAPKCRIIAYYCKFKPHCRDCFCSEAFSVFRTTAQEFSVVGLWVSGENKPHPRHMVLCCLSSVPSVRPAYPPLSERWQVVLMYLNKHLESVLSKRYINFLAYHLIFLRKIIVINYIFQLVL